MAEIISGGHPSLEVRNVGFRLPNQNFCVAQPWQQCVLLCTHHICHLLISGAACAMVFVVVSYLSQQCKPKLCASIPRELLTSPWARLSTSSVTTLGGRIGCGIQSIAWCSRPWNRMPTSMIGICSLREQCPSQVSIIPTYVSVLVM